ncbi:hypothetical protein [Leptospira barantonii]|nr:hypothetical protein [Leptospira barantonii]
MIVLFSMIQCNQKEDSKDNSALLALAGTGANILSQRGTTFRESDVKGNVLSENNQTQSSNGHSAIVLKGDAQMAGGGLLVYIKELDGNKNVSNKVIPVVIENGVPRFVTEGGKEYMAYLEFFIDGVNNTEIDGCMLAVPFIATGIDKIEFYVTSQKVGLFVNKNSRESNIFYFASGANGKGNSPQERADWRKANYLEYGGDGFVVDYVYKNN